MARIAVIVAAVTVIGVLGFVIDAQSRVPVVRHEIPPGEYAIFATGRVEGTTPEIELRPQLAGRVEEILVAEGQLVKQGDVLLRLDDQQHRHAVDLAVAELALAQAQLDRLVNGARTEEIAEAAALYRGKLAGLELAELSWQRTSKLQETRVVAQEEADRDRIRVATLQAEVAAARARLDLLEAPPRPDEVRMEEARVQAAGARLELAQVQLGRMQLLAPCDGQVLEIDAEVGELTGPESPQPVAILADTSGTHVRAFVEEMDAPRVRVGMLATVVTDGLPDKQFKGRVYRVSPRMDRKELWSDHPAERYDTKTREIWIELDQGELLVVGLRVDVVIDPESLAPPSGATRESPRPTAKRPKESRPARPLAPRASGDRSLRSPSPQSQTQTPPVPK